MSEAVKQTMMENPPEAGTLFELVDGSEPDLDERGDEQPDPFVPGQIKMKPRRVTAFCVSVAPLPGGGGFSASTGDGKTKTMHVVDYVER